MKKSIFFAAVAALVLAGCAKNETFVNVADQDAVSFGAYTGRVETKAGPTDDMNLDALKDHGFGVFATYSGTKDFEDPSLAGATNDFMFNEWVKYDATAAAWTYSPIKYWPNPTNGQNADAQKVSFFAYAPYANPAATGETVGITGFSIEGGHNMVHYGFSNDKDTPNVDLMWGYKAKDTSTNPATYTINNNLTRTTDKVKFIFQHLLSKLGGSQEGDITDPTDPNYVANGLIIKASPVVDPTAEYNVDGSGDFGGNKGSKITVSKIIVESAPEVDAITGLPVTDSNGDNVTYATGIQTGKLDLYTGEFALDAAAQPVQFKQTLSADPTELAANTDYSELADIIKEPVTFTTFAALPIGVTKKAVNVYKDENSPIILVPGTRPVVDVTITYYVRTYDEKVPGGFSEVPQTVFGRVKFPLIEKNKKYNLLMILGLNSVEFEASVEDWTVVGSTWNDANNNGVVDPGEVSGSDEQIGLPNNL